MLFAIFFSFWRFLQIITLIPTIGLLAYFVDGYNKLNALTPTYILVLFIVSVLAGAWAIFTIFSYHRSSTNASFVALIDILFVGAFIGAVYALRFIADADCTNVTRGSSVDVSLGIFGSASLNGVRVNVDKSCAMLKAAFAFGILNAIFFFFTAALACLHGDRLSAGERKTYVRENHSHRHSHRSSAPHSRHSSHHSHRRVYV
ncbi:hypothetical protein F5B22DRAFT_622751 [Xylaria bambusicola]|uniref:uncharacterized protein n=1 Tax=Xylaria bambusicola TaxID=326684 RepID=UPI002007D3F9|nr:uncharacterized protein F5B22DRAFT_622751 [Xylaria bambusicola]KAI0506643.1 hypothetical protein F5B22DRAFT_622751 [Xylaria bambusicola]